MASKGKGKGKLFQAVGPSISAAISSTKQHEGALDNAFFVEAQMKNNDWARARIIDCRLSKDYDSKRQKNDSSYDYYVHYENYNRRMDEWITRNRIKLTDDIIVEEPALKKKAKKGDDKRDYPENDEHEGMDQQSLIQHEMHTKFKTIDSIEFGSYKCETWYYSPFPSGYHQIECLYVCEYCLSFYVHKSELVRHQQGDPPRCQLMTLKHPPGDEIYRDTDRRISIFEVDGQKNPIYCENLCYISKLFLDHKNLYYDTEPFLFFILAEYNETGYHIVGYFSKEKESTQGWNLSCILTLPFMQRKGYGKFLIAFSYVLSLIENKIGTPERPLSDLGRESYLSWWTQRIIEYLRDRREGEEVTLANITKATGIRDQDILWALVISNTLLIYLFKEQKQLIKYQQSTPLICTDPNYLNQIYQKAGRPAIPVKIEALHWVPYKRSKEVNKGDKLDK